MTTLISTTLLAIAAASGMASITVEVELRGPRPLASTQVMARLQSPMESGGYAYNPTAYTYGEVFMNWLQYGLSYDDFDANGDIYTKVVTVTFDDNVPVGTYRVQIWYELNGNGVPDDELEPITYAETEQLPNGDGTLIHIDLGDSVQAKAVLAEGEAIASGFVRDEDFEGVEGATVTATQLADDVTFTRSVLTDETGYFTFTGDSALPTGLYYSLDYSFVASLGDIQGEAVEEALSAGSNTLPTLGLDLPETPLTVELGAFTVTPIDDNDNGLFDRIHIEGTLTASEGFNGYIDAGVLDADGGLPLADMRFPEDYEYSWSAGSNTFEIDVPGTELALSGGVPTSVGLAAYSGTTIVASRVQAVTNLGDSTDYDRPAIELVSISAAPYDTDDNGELYDGVRVKIHAIANRDGFGSFAGVLFGNGMTYLPMATGGIPLQFYSAGDLDVELSIPAAGISAGGIAPVRAEVTAFDEYSRNLGTASTDFEGGEIADYESAPLTIPREDVVVTPTLDEEGKITNIKIAFKPWVNETGEFAFTTTLYSVEWFTIDSQSVSDDGSFVPLPEGRATTIEQDFAGDRLNLALPFLTDFTLDHFEIVASSLELPFLAHESFDIGPYTRSDFVRGHPAVELPLPDAASFELLCRTLDATDLESCASATTPWDRMVVRYPITVNKAGTYSFSNTMSDGSFFPLAYSSDAPANYEAGQGTHDAIFRGSHVYRAGALSGGDPARVDIYAFDEYYNFVSITNKALTGIRSTDFADLGIGMAIGAPAVVAEDLRVPVTLEHTGHNDDVLGLHMVLMTAGYDFIDYVSTDVVLTPGTVETGVVFDGARIYQALLGAEADSASFRMVAYLVDSNGELLLYDEAGPTASFALSNFPAPELLLGSEVSEEAVDPDADGLYDSLDLTIPVTVRAGLPPTPFKVSIVLYGSDFEFVTGDFSEVTLAGGDTRLPVDATRILGRHISASGVNGPYTAYVWVYTATGDFVGFRDVKTSAYLASSFESGGIRITSVRDEPTPATPLYNGIAITADLAVSPGASGTLTAYAIAYTSTWDFVGMDVHTVTLDDTLTAEQFVIPGDQIRQAKLNGNIRTYIALYDTETGELFAHFAGFSLGAYDYTDFGITGLEFGVPSTFADARATGDEGPVLRISPTMTVGTPDTYDIAAWMYDTNWNYVAFASRSLDLTAGDATVALDFDPRDLIDSGSPGPYRVYFAAYGSNGFATYTFDPKITDTYPLASWGVARPLDITAITTNLPATGPAPANIEITIEYTVNSPGTYRIGGRILSTGNDAALLGGNVVTRTFTGGDVGSSLTSTVTVRSADVFAAMRSGYSGQLDIVARAIRGRGVGGQIVDKLVVTPARAFTPADFTGTDAITLTGTNTWTSVQSDADSQVDALTVNVGINVLAGGTFEVRPVLRTSRGVVATLNPGPSFTLSAGDGQSIALTFSGADIRASRLNGNYELAFAIYSVEGETYTLMENAVGITSPTTYRAIDFN